MKCGAQDAVASVFLIVALSAPTLAAAQEGPPDLPTVAQAVRHDTSPPLRDLVPLPPQRAIADRQIRLRVPVDLADRLKPSPGREDPIRQIDGSPTPGASPTPPFSNSFEGLSDDDNKAVLGFRVVPPDTEGDVGKDHYVQFVNLIFAVYNKTTGAKVLGPLPGNFFWDGFGGICEKNNDGDPIVLYDHLADRWVVSQFAIGKGDKDGHQCIAVSTTSDPTGAYHRYDFFVSPRAFNDYPKLGVWPDGYYMTANEFGRKGFRGAIAVAFERDAMLNGAAAAFVKFGPLKCGNECFFSLQPSHLEGPPPPAGTPNTFLMAFDDQTWGTGSKPDGYRLWDFSVDFSVDPPTGSFDELPQADTDEFDANLCNFKIDCIPQPAPGEKLDPLSEFTMYRAQYRTFDTHDSIVVNHTVDANGNDLAGVRWAELRRVAGGWAVHQTGTFAPTDGNHRWMGSIAMDGAGNIALGYSVSSNNTFPSVRYVTREADDPLGELSGGEVELIAGGGSQTKSFNRWGDYSTMSVDPVDDCTFWYTQEYYANDGSFDFKTRIGSFKLPSCGAPVTGSDLTVGKTVDNATPGEGDTVTYTVTVTNNGPDDATGVEVTDLLPTGVTLGTASATQGTYDNNGGVWTVGSLANGGSATLTLPATVDSDTGGITNTASITAADQGDPDSTNNSASADITVATPGGTATLDVTITKHRIKGRFDSKKGVGKVEVQADFTVDSGSSNAIVLKEVTDFGTWSLEKTRAVVTINGAKGNFDVSLVDGDVVIDLGAAGKTLNAGDVVQMKGLKLLNDTRGSHLLTFQVIVGGSVVAEDTGAVVF